MPALGNELVWGAAFAMYSVIMGHLGEDIVAANSVVNTVRQLASVLCFGMAYGGAIVLGKDMGAGDLMLPSAMRRALREAPFFPAFWAVCLCSAFIRFCLTLQI